MQTTNSNEPRKLALPFAGRRKEVAQLQRLHEQRKHVLIVGAEGIGKSALVTRLRESLNLRVCPASERLSGICEALERELDLGAGDLHIVQRKNRLLKLLKGTKRAVVFDGAGWTTSKLSSFIENVSERVPVWLCARSEHPWDIGHIWPLLVRFEKVEIKPFHPAETRELIETAVRLGVVPPSMADTVERLHHLCAGNPGVLCELIAGLATGHYDPHKKFDLRLLDLDRRIQLLPASGRTHAI
ncbi:MAG: AAA family ATPase [Limisphaerales bacterium]